MSVRKALAERPLVRKFLTQDKPTGKSTKVAFCSADWCKHYKSNKCDLSEISITPEGECGYSEKR